MSKLKIIYFDSSAIDSISLENRLRSVCVSFYVIKEGLILANCNKSAQELFNELVPDNNRANVFVGDLDLSEKSYWGYMNTELWKWLNENKKP